MQYGRNDHDTRTTRTISTSKIWNWRGYCPNQCYDLAKNRAKPLGPVEKNYSTVAVDTVDTEREDTLTCRVCGTFWSESEYKRALTGPLLVSDPPKPKGKSAAALAIL